MLGYELADEPRSGSAWLMQPSRLGNLGVSALGVSVRAGVLRRLVDWRIIAFDSGRGRGPLTVAASEALEGWSSRAPGSPIGLHRPESLIGGPHPSLARLQEQPKRPSDTRSHRGHGYHRWRQLLRHRRTQAVLGHRAVEAPCPARRRAAAAASPPDLRPPRSDADPARQWSSLRTRPASGQ